MEKIADKVMHISDYCPAFPSEQHNGMRLRDYFAAHAPTEEIEGIIPPTAKECGEWLGLPENIYNVRLHYFKCVAKARMIYADEMLSARQGEKS